MRELAFRVAELGESAVGPLCAALDDPELLMRQYAIVALSQAPDADSRVKALVAVASPKVQMSASEITKGVAALGEQALEPLLRALESGDENVQGCVGEAIARLPSSVVERLIKALDNAAPGVRGKLAMALGRIGDRRAVAHLINLLTDEDAEVRRNAGYGLRCLGDPSAEEALTHTAEHDTSYWVRWTAIKALLKLGWTPKAKNHQILFAVLNLDQFGGGLQSLDEAERIAGVTKFGKEAVECLLFALESGSEQVCEYAARALGEIGDERARGPLLRAAQRYGYKVRDAANFALKKLGTPPGTQLATSTHGKKPEKPTLESLAGRYGECSKCSATVPLAEARQVHWDWDGVDAYGYFCPMCYIEGNSYIGQLVGRLGLDLVDQYS